MATYDERGHVVGEVGLSVDQSVRGAGVGRRMLDASFGQAAELGVTQAYVLFLHGNSPMRALMRKMGAEVTSEDGESRAAIHINEAPEHRRVQRHVTAGGIEVFESAPKEAERLVLLVHGAGGDAWQWRRKLQPYLYQRGIRSLAVALSHHGSSTATHEGSVESYAREVQQVVEQFGAPTTVVGHSLGGYIVQRLLEVVHADEAVLVGSVPPGGLQGPELSAALQALKSIKARAVLSQAMSQPLRRAEPRVGRIQVIGGFSDTVIPPALVERTAQAYGTQAQFVPGGHALMLGRSWERVANTVANTVQHLDTLRTTAERAVAEDDDAESPRLRHRRM
jgi:pimeloyl-ACP methyl ester carboxylesterase